jgi:hypothetical protein
MDTSVIAALAKWPNVPAVFGWLSLTARGQWRLQGEPILNAAICEFIGRNYASDDRGRWYFQNGPQRVFVELEATPWIYRLGSNHSILTHTGRMVAECHGAAVLDGGRLLLTSEIGPGVVDDRDAAQFIQAVVDSTGRPLPGPDVERWLDGALEAMIAPQRLGLTGLPRQVERGTLSGLAPRYGFDPRPEP